MQSPVRVDLKIDIDLDFEALDGGRTIVSFGKLGEVGKRM